MKVAEALLLRKQLEAKVQQLQPLKNLGDNGVFEQKVERRPANENVDTITITTPKVSLADLTKTYDHYASELRKIDAAIQQANWANELNYTETAAPAEPSKG